MQTTTVRTALSALFCTAALAAVGTVQAAPAPGDGNPHVNATTQKIWDNPDLTEPTKGVRTLQDYIVQEKELFDYLFKHHPLFKYAEEGRVIGMYKVSTRGSEYLGEGNAKKYSALQPGARPSASQYRLPQTSILDFPNKFVGPEKCGSCHAVQYEKWKRSRHAQTIRFPGEHPEVNNDLKKKLYGSDASILADGITPDVIYATVGTPRTKYGYIDAWLARGSYHVRGGPAFCLKASTLTTSSSLWARRVRNTASSISGSSVVPTTSKTAVNSPRRPVRSLPAATSSPAAGLPG